MSDANENSGGSDPLNNNSTPEVCDGVDNDLNDGVDEGFTNTDGDGEANCVDADDDNDGVTDVDENAAGSNPQNDQSTPEVCDWADNDLNQGVDEGCTISETSTVTIRGREPFKGKVGAEHALCISHRTVKLMKVRSGPDLKIGRDETDEQGAWRVSAGNNPTGKFYAQVIKRRIERNNGSVVICKAATSETLQRP